VGFGYAVDDTTGAGGRRVNPDEAEVPEAEDARQQAERVGASVIELDCASKVAALRTGDAYRGADHSAETVAKQSGLRVVLVALEAGGLMHEHHADSPITVHGLEGRLRIDIEGQSYELTPGRVLVVAAGLAHSVHAIERSAFLLTIGGLRSAHGA
jgi:quercetin dioxygenase-like cupin family protein